MGEDKAPGRGTGAHAAAGAEQSQEDRLAELEARMAALEGATDTDGETPADEV